MMKKKETENVVALSLLNVVYQNFQYEGKSWKVPNLYFFFIVRDAIVDENFSSIGEYSSIIKIRRK